MHAVSRLFVFDVADRVCQVAMAVKAILLKYIFVEFLDPYGFVKITCSECVTMMPAI